MTPNFQIQMKQMQQNGIVDLLRIALIGASAALLFMSQVNVASGYTLRTLYSFCAHKACRDGMQPLAGLTADSAGNLYGTTSLGGKFGDGTIFEMTPNPDRRRWEH